MSSALERLPNEVLLLIAQNLSSLSSTLLNPNSLALLVRLARTCRRLNGFAESVLYGLALKNFPYLVCWACETANIGLLKKLLKAGADPNYPYAGNDTRREAYGYASSPRGQICDGKGDNPFASTITYMRPLKDWNHLSTLDHVYRHREHRRRGSYQRPQGYPPSHSSLEDDSNNNNNEVDLADESIDLAEHAPLVKTYPQAFRAHTSVWFPMHAAAFLGSIEAINVLTEYGAHIDPPSYGLCECAPTSMTGVSEKIHWTPLHTAFCSGKMDAAKRLISLGSSLKIDFFETTAMHHAAAFDAPDIMEMLLKKQPGFNMDCKDHKGWTPIKNALVYSMVPPCCTFKLLLDHGADVNETCAGLTALAALCAQEMPNPDDDIQQSGLIRSVDLLLDRGAQINPNTGSSALEIAFGARNYRLYDHLLQRGATWPGPVPVISLFSELVAGTQDATLDHDLDSPTKEKRIAEAVQGLSLLLKTDERDVLIKDFRSLFWAVKVPESPMTDMLLDAGARNISPQYEDSEEKISREHAELNYSILTHALLHTWTIKMESPPSFFSRLVGLGAPVDTELLWRATCQRQWNFVYALLDTGVKMSLTAGKETMRRAFKMANRRGSSPDCGASVPSCQDSIVSIMALVCTREDESHVRKVISHLDPPLSERPVARDAALWRACQRKRPSLAIMSAIIDASGGDMSDSQVGYPMGHPAIRQMIQQLSASGGELGSTTLHPRIMVDILQLLVKVGASFGKSPGFAVTRNDPELKQMPIHGYHDFIKSVCTVNCPCRVDSSSEGGYDEDDEDDEDDEYEEYDDHGQFGQPVQVGQFYWEDNEGHAQYAQYLDGDGLYGEESTEESEEEWGGSDEEE